MLAVHYRIVLCGMCTNHCYLLYPYSLLQLPQRCHLLQRSLSSNISNISSNNISNSNSSISTMEEDTTAHIDISALHIISLTRICPVISVISVLKWHLDVEIVDVML